MAFKLLFTDEAASQMKALEKDKGLLKRLKAVCTALAYLETNPRHQGLNTHKYSSLRGFNGEDVFEAYAENQPSAACRICWHYGPGKTVIMSSPSLPIPRLKSKFGAPTSNRNLLKLREHFASFCFVGVW